MSKQDHLMLGLVRLKAAEILERGTEGLVFLFSKGGIGKFTSKVATQRLVPGDILVFEAAAGSKLEVFDGKGEFLFWSFSVTFENLLPLFFSNEISLLHNITEGFKATKVYQSSSPMAAECHRLLGVVPPEFNLDHRGQLIRIVATILSAEFKAGHSHRSGYVRTEDHMVQVFEKLSASELINLSVGELADKFSCSRRHLNRIFHQHFGVSVASLRMEMRLLKAISLLRDPDIKIINVAEQCGFNHLGLFNTCFKRRFGTSPGQWHKAPGQASAGAAKKLEKKPICPLQTTGACPLGGKLEGSPPTVMTTLAGKITNGANILEDLKRRDLMFENQSGADDKDDPSEAKADE